MKESGNEIVAQLCAFMEVNGIHYLETRSRRAHYGINTIIEANTYDDDGDSEETEVVE